MAVSSTTTRQSDQVLARATTLRNEIDALVARVADGLVTLAQVFERAATEPVYGFVYLVKIAEAVPGIGKVRARRELEKHGLGERTRVSETPPSARDSLVKALA
ncbi:MAG: hypothetical protein RL072_741 [Actinomycetota bacterium]|jgi:hypothetical protein